jgi:deazaflavin-dependent oxidoreductase (nitroreductase family)
LDDRPDGREPFAARLHFITRLTNRVQRALIPGLRRYFQRAPGWVLLTTRGRKSGRPREVLLPCERFADGLIVISTYGRRSNWIRNIERDPDVLVTCGGWVVPGRAEIIDDLETKRSLVSAHPFFAPAPVFPINTLHVTLLRPLMIAFLRRWVTPRPVVLVRPAFDERRSSSSKGWTPE